MLKILRGNPHEHTLNRDEPAPDALSPACPDVLEDPVARAEWTRAMVPAIRIGQVTVADLTLAIAHCELWATWRSQLAEAVKRPHLIPIGKHKYPMPNPARLMANKTLTLLAGVDEKLGFSPTSRSKVSVKGAAARLDKPRARFFEASRG